MQRSQANTLSVLFGEVTMNAKLQLPKSPPDTTTIVKPGEDLKERAIETREEFVGKTCASVLALWCLGLFWAHSAFSQTTAPTVTFTVPANAATGVAINEKIAVTFSEAMDPATIKIGRASCRERV